MGIIYNEWLKSWYGRKVWLFALIMLLFIGGAVALFLFTQSNLGSPMVADDFAEVSVSVFPTFVMLFGVVLIAGAIAGEFSSGTVKQLLIRPTSRHAILFGKWFGNLLLAMFMLFAIVLLSTVIGLIVFSTEGMSTGETFRTIFEMAIYQLPTLVFYMALATLIAVLTKSTALTIIITFAPLFFSGILQLFISQYEWSKWLIVSHIEFFSNYYDSEIMFVEPPFESMWGSLAFLGAHIVVILIAAHLVFKKRDVL
ncbi:MULTISPECIES: ABC transporter permease [Shouchella]|uniref:ABC transporter permease subunit n=2 Tax=Shouchella TaxID=2893057 RepID=A0ABY7W1N8_9BACI|nr:MULTISPECIES: ABC transporter permease subunit [Shouchella]MED4129514.1 ABC transporter permease subunit [Shouchella miscanthi]WDF02779.1 ABC transporter permease subunit [Shouchella hunanensis]